MSAPTRGLRVALIAGEHSGDQLGFKLMRALRAATGARIEFSGVGGEAMEAEGLKSLFPLSDIAVMGVVPVIAKLPTLLARIRQTADSIVAERPDGLVIIDSPDFTHRVARRVRRALPDLPVIDYVSPSVWAWRPGRARAMRAYVDCVLALLPFEPAAHARLGGPRCVYVGHPLIERLNELRPNADEARRRVGEPPVVAVLPGSRRSVIGRLMDDFGGALALLQRDHGPLEIVLPTLPHVESEVRARAEKWAVKPRIEVGEAAKLAVFRVAHAALAASGTVTLELALAGVPMVGAYKVSRFEEPLKYFVKLPFSILPPNLILGERAIPEILQRDCTPAHLAAALAAIMREGPARQAQLAALARLDALMLPADTGAPSERAAREVLATIAARGARKA
ncbi:MAG TPA: lipid-A-disaccharide synthase [Roseiarcus sp.]|nr:lipid-A-disaccharide synthase [Roseiarcus sp.]